MTSEKGKFEFQGDEELDWFVYQENLAKEAILEQTIIEEARKTRNEALEPKNLTTFLRSGLNKKAKKNLSIKTPVYTSSYSSIIELSRKEASTSCSNLVHDVHVLVALLKNPGSSLEKALKLLDSSPRECLRFFELLNPVSKIYSSSTFPSQLDDI